MIKKIKALFTKEKISVIIFDGSMMQYRTLTPKELKKIKNIPKCKDWIITINKDHQC
ncbi:hypothetical protein [Candidatus Marinarcus aquaticus]|uniref:hypothetical protein n=1 Tax=Candidatus Marinarcus aquaticus TaxID=2044504 RepID=UPI0013E97F42|nr:hypothetical protein [Candidatus Marinarcus aquaticus]